MHNAWDQISALYQARQQRSPHEIHYGPWAPTEQKLQLLGDVRGQRVLELGCGGGQCTLAFAKTGRVGGWVGFER